MKWKLKAPGQVPYGAQYMLDLPERGMVGTGTVFDMLETRVRLWRKANGWPMGLGLSEEIEQCVCEKYPAECEADDTLLPIRRRLTLDDVIRGTKVILAMKLHPDPLVPKAEAERRGAICEKCPLAIQFPKPCGGLCGELKTIVDSVIGGYDTRFDTDYRSCSVCSCYFSSQIRIKYELLDKGLTDQMRGEFRMANEAYNCWKIPGAI